MSAVKPTKKPKTSLDTKYKKFLSVAARHHKNLSNPFNLFDDFNASDMAWLQIAKKYIRSYRRSRKLDL